MLKIQASKCGQCGKVVVPPRLLCPYCGPGVKAMELVELSNKGVIQSFTVYHFPPEGFQSPVLLALVKLDNDASVLCTGPVSYADNIRINQDVFLEIDESGKFILSLNQ
jgi:uncharacterized OB-fold protein